MRVKNCFLGKIQYLIKNNSDFFRQDRLNQTPFLIICKNKYLTLPILESLTPHASLHIQDIRGRNAFHNICKNKSVTIELLTFCINNGGKVTSRDRENRTPFTFLCSNPKATVDMVKYLHKHDAVIDEKKESSFITPLHFACQIDNIEIIKYLVENKAAVNGNNYSHSPLWLATSYGSEKAVTYLLQQPSLMLNKEDKEIVEKYFGDDNQIMKLFKKKTE